MVDAVKILGSLLGGNAMGGAGGNLLGSLLGGGSSGSSGGLGSLLGGLAGGSGGGAGGLGGLLASLTGGAGGSGGAGGLGGLLSGLAGGAAGAGAAGGLGGLLSGLTGGGEAQAAPQQQQQPSGLNPFGDSQAAPPMPDANAQATLLIRAMVSAAKSDGRVDETEQKNILEKLGDVDQAEMDFVKGELARPLDVQGLVSSVPAGMEEHIYAVSLLTINLDSQEEAKYLDSLARGMGIDHQACNAIHQQLGAPQLYS